MAAKSWPYKDLIAVYEGDAEARPLDTVYADSGLSG
jgi:hypothetical protein